MESEGAEFLVLGHLLIEGVHCYKAYVNFPGYDLTAVNPITGKTAKIQVKSRWATDYDKSFPLKNFNCNFVVHVALTVATHSENAQQKLVQNLLLFMFYQSKKQRMPLKKAMDGAKCA
jgi:hypothetical protein